MSLLSYGSFWIIACVIGVQAPSDLGGAGRRVVTLLPEEIT